MTTPGHRAPTGELLHRLSDAAGQLWQQEFRQGQEELKDKARQSAAGLALLAGGGALGVCALGTGTALLVRLLDRALPRPASAAVATAALGGAAAGLAALGARSLRGVDPLPEQTLQSVREDVEAVAAAAAGPKRTTDE